MIELGLSRIQALLQRTPQTWKAIHIGGTNGKGSICAYLTAMLRANNISCGRFTSPHLIDRWDCIWINGRPVLETKFRHFEDIVKKRDQELRVGATEFELLAATAFEIFEAEKIEFGVVEVGLGGKLDATNALKDKVVTVIAKIGLDHQKFLGNTLEEIALHKAGIMRTGVPCVVDASNDQRVLAVLEAHSKDAGASLIYAKPETSSLVQAFRLTLEPHQKENLATAHEAFRVACPQYAGATRVLVPAIASVSWPGRLQMIDIRSLTGRTQPVLLDGAHNPQSAEALKTYVDKHLRKTAESPVTWVFAATQGKDLTGIFKQLQLRKDDSVGAVEFGPVDGMPWINPMKAANILGHLPQVKSTYQSNAEDPIMDVLEWAIRTSNEGPMVITGSLYLVSNILRLLREVEK